MNIQARAFAFSGIIHAAFFAAVILLSAMIPNKKELVVIDFSIIQKEKEGTPVPESKPSAPKAVKKQTAKKASPRPVVREQKLREASPPLPPLTQEDPVMEKPVPAPVDDVEPVPIEETAAMEDIEDSAYAGVETDELIEGTEAGAPDVASVSSSAGEGGGKEGSAVDYSYIRERVQGNITYPSMARRMGWEGKVMVSFIICCDGTVKDIEIQDSSGNRLLDRNALEAVERSSPFPEQPIEAKVIIPIVYRLDESG